MPIDFETALQNYADLIVSAGLNLQAGQRLLVRAPIQAAPLVRRVAASAYRQGASLVDVLWGDEQLSLIRFKHAPRDSFEEFPAWRASVMEETLRNGDALLSMYAEDPELLKDQDPKLVSVAMNTAMKHNMPVSQLISNNASNWVVVSMPIPSWTAKVFPGLPPQEAEKKLWEAIFETCRVDQDDPVAVWKEHARQLEARCRYLNQKSYAALHFTGPGTNLTVGLPEGHIWRGGQLESGNGIPFIPNLPTEEVFTMPHKGRVEGAVTSTKPLSLGNKLIDSFTLTFKEGKVVDFHAEGEGHEVLAKILETDEGARRLGEVALVPQTAPTARLGIMFFNALFDENAASHLAIGEAYQFTLEGGTEMSKEQLEAAGANQSMTHVDFMVGSDSVDVDGISSDGSREPIMRQGNWTFTV